MGSQVLEENQAVSDELVALVRQYEVRQQEVWLSEKGATIIRHPQEAWRRSEAHQDPCLQQALVGQRIGD